MAFWWKGFSLLLCLTLLVLLRCQLVHGRTFRHQISHRHTRANHYHRQRQNITLAIILPEKNMDYPWAWPRIGPAVERALRTVNSDPVLLPNHQLTYAFKNSEDKDGICSESIAPLMAVDLKLAYDPWVFIGPGCSYTSSPVGFFTTHWDIPMVTAGAPAVAFDDGVYLSITNTGPTHKKLGKFAQRICEHFGWREHVMLTFNDNKVDDRPCYFATEGLYNELKKANITVSDRVFEENKPPLNYSDIIFDIQQAGRGEWDSQVISVREAKALPKTNSHEWKNKFICVEEPFERNNVARAVHEKVKFDAIKTQFAESWRKLQQRKDLNSILPVRAIINKELSKR